MYSLNRSASLASVYRETLFRLTEIKRLASTFHAECNSIGGCPHLPAGRKKHKQNDRFFGGRFVWSVETFLNETCIFFSPRICTNLHQ